MRILFPLLALALSAGAQQRIYVTETGEAKVAVVDGLANRVVGQIPVSGAPQSVAVSIDGRRLYISSETKNAVDVVDRQTSKPVRSVAVGRRPGDILLAPEGRKLFVSARGAGTVDVLDTATLEKEKTIFTGKEPAGLALTPDNTRIVAASSGDHKLSVINIRKEAVEFEIPVSGAPVAMAFESDKALVIHRIFVLLAAGAGVDIIDYAARKSTGHLPGAIRGLAVSPDRRALWTSAADGVTVLSLPELKKVASVEVGKGASGIVFTADGKRALIASETDGTLSIVDAAKYAEIARIPVGMAPRGIAVAE